MRPRSRFPYQKLPGSLRGFIRRASLWEGSDHLLAVSGTRFSEEYRRFYYRDIEAIIIQKCPRSGSIGLYVASALVCAIAGTIAATSVHAPLAWAIAAVSFAFLLSRILLTFRYSCRCLLQTAVSRAELPSLYRTWTAAKAVERVRSRIADAQGLLPEDITSMREAAGAVTVSSTLIREPAAARNTGEKPASFGVTCAIATFILLLIDAAATFAFRDAPPNVLNSAWFRMFTGVLVLAEGVAVVLALLGIYKIKALRRLRNFLLASLGFFATEVWFNLNFNQLYLTERAVFHNMPSVGVAWHWIELGSGTLALLLGLGGLILILLNWQTYRRGDLLAA